MDTNEPITYEMSIPKANGASIGAHVQRQLAELPDRGEHGGELWQWRSLSERRLLWRGDVCPFGQRPDLLSGLYGHRH